MPQCKSFRNTRPSEAFALTRVDRDDARAKPLPVQQAKSRNSDGGAALLYGRSALEARHRPDVAAAVLSQGQHEQRRATE